MADATLTADLDALLVAVDDAAAKTALTNIGGAILGANTFTAAQVIDGSADAIQLRIQASLTPTQTADVFVVENSGGTVLFSVQPSGATTFLYTITMVDANSELQWNGQAVLSSPGDGRIKMRNWGANVTQLDFATASTLKIRNTDNTDYGTLYFKLPTTNPGLGVIWNDSGVIKVGT